MIMTYVKCVLKELEEELNKRRSNTKKISKLLKQLKEITEKEKTYYIGFQRKFLVNLMKNRYEYKNVKKILKKKIVKKLSYIIRKLEREGVIKKDAAGFWRIL